MLTIDQKNQIAKAAQDYCTANQLSQQQLAIKTDINAGYLSLILRGQYNTTVNGKNVEITDKWFVRLADFIGVRLQKTYWEVIPTAEFTAMMSALEDSKEHAETRIIIIETGNGKTFSIDKFANQNPQFTYTITLNEVYKIGDVIKDLCKHLNIEETGSAAGKIKRINAKLGEIARAGNKPVIIFDEAEMASLNLLRMLKSLYDGVKGLAGITLVGTPQLLTNLSKACTKDKVGMPQFYRRFKAGIRQIKTSKANKYASFYAALGIEDTGLQKLLNLLCDNYGELNDYLQPALRDADRQGLPLTESFFRIMYNMPK